MNVVALSAFDRGLLTARFAQHANSHRRMRSALLEVDAHDALDRLDALRRLEKRFAVDLASVCWRHERRDHTGTHPIERFVIDYITEPGHGERGDELWVLLDRLREVRDLMEGRLVGEPGS